VTTIVYSPAPRNMLVEEDAVTSYFVNVQCGTFADDVRDIGAVQIQERWVLGVGEPAGPDVLRRRAAEPVVDLMEDNETNLIFSMHDARKELLQAWEDLND